jgi:UDP-N-acetylglucosamine acyltransferase
MAVVKGSFSISQKSKWIHATAIVEAGAQIGKNVVIGPYCVIGPNVVLGNYCELKSSVIVEGVVNIGDHNKIFSHAVIGQEPQDLKYAGERSSIIIGHHNRIREYCTIHPGTRGGGMVTRIGDNNLLMVNIHVAHDCQIGSNCILANNVVLGGHVQVEDYAVVGGASAVHQRVRIGRHSMIGGMTAIARDVIPYGLVVEDRKVSLNGINITGLRRRKFSRRDINDLKNFYEDVFSAEGNLLALVKKYKEKYAHSPVVRQVVKFLEEPSNRCFTV